MNPQFPSGTVTFLFTDIEGSTKLAQEYPVQWEALRARHHAILQAAMDAHNGYVFQIIGDAFCGAFPTASDALRAAMQSQKYLQAEKWGEAVIKVRMGIHTGKAEIQTDGQYQGYLSMSRVQRVMSVAYGRQILVSNTGAELMRGELPEGTSLLDMQEHRLKGLLNPEHLWQAASADLPRDFPPLQSLNRFPNNLPIQLTSFIGREKEIAELKEELNDHHLVTLTGSGGTGKTRLSLQVAAEVLEQDPDGVWFIELAPLTDPDLIPLTILSALGTGEQQGKTVMQSLSEYVHLKGLLLVLDNCEHLIEACARLANILLSNSQGLKILASSREALGVKGEMAWHVPSLSVPDIKHLPDIQQFSQFEAVRLFSERAMLAQAHFTVTTDNQPAIAQICSRLDGIPLALELAAARVKALSVEQIAARLDDRFRLLTGGARTSLPRQQTLRAMIDWSYNLLSEGERILFRRLAVFVGGWTLEAAEQVCAEASGDSDVLDLLTRLVDKSLVSMDEARYHMLETTRQYAREKLFESGEGKTLRNCHLDYFSNFAAQNDVGEEGPIDLDLAIKAMRLDQDNLRAALLWAFDSKPPATLELAVPLSEYWLGSDLWEECIQWLQRSIDVTAGHSASLRLRAMVNLVMCLLQVAEGDQAQAIIASAMEEAQTQPDKKLLATTLAMRGWVDLETGHGDSAQEFFERALAPARTTDNTFALGIALAYLGSILGMQGDFALAEAYFHETLSLKFDLRLQRMGIRAITYWMLSSLEFARGEIQKAHANIGSALALQRITARNPTMTAHYTEMLGRILIAEGNLGSVRKTLQESIAILHDHNTIACLAHGLESFARLALAENNPSLAVHLLGAAEAYLESLSMSMIPTEKVLYDQSVIATRAALPEEAFESAWKQGRALNIEEAIALVLEERNE